jgi:hypothetical protein
MSKEPDRMKRFLVVLIAVLAVVVLYGTTVSGSSLPPGPRLSLCGDPVAQIS